MTTEKNALPDLPDYLSWHTKENPARILVCVPNPDDGSSPYREYFPLRAFNSVQECIATAGEKADEIGKKWWPEWPVCNRNRHRSEVSAAYDLPQFVSIVKFNQRKYPGSDIKQSRMKVVVYLPNRKPKSFSVGRRSLDDAVSAAVAWRDENISAAPDSE